ncbi:hypothetical protein ACQKWADRAFT_303974 [Trichoderma austrokoningii]
MLSSAPKSRCSSSWRLAHSKGSFASTFTLTPSSILLIESSLVPYRDPCRTIRHISLNPTHARSSTQTRDPYEAFGETLFSGLSWILHSRRF